jgi:CheY-like chemotaxis protein
LARILIAEDYDDLREMIKDLLTQESHCVMDAPNGRVAQDMLNQDTFDLIILDWELPHVFGIDICKQFRSRGGKTPILMLTGKKDISDKEQGFDAGADDYLTKPFHPKELSARVKALLRRAASSISVNLVETPEAMVGQTISDRYEVLSLLGRGSTGLIYRAKHLFLKRDVAVKILYPQLVIDAESMARFKQEAQAVSTLNHPNIVTVYDFGILPSGLPYLAMDYSEGTTLYDVLANEDHLPPHRAVPIFLQACQALAHSHSRGVIHRDIKPSNIMLIAQPDGTEFLKIVDFGIAKLLKSEQSAQLTQDGEVLGSPLYMSPEQCLGQDLDQRSDIFSLGCVMYTTLCGKDPFVGGNIMETMYLRTVEKAKPFSQIRPDLSILTQLEKVVQKALLRHPMDRQQSMSELASELTFVAKRLGL